VENIMSSKLFTTRQGTILLGVAAAVLAAIALLVYLNSYRNSVNSKNQAISVLVAKSLIQKGTPGDVVGTTNLYQVTSIPKKQVKTGAFVDPATLTGKVAATDIYPGQQLTADDFAAANANALTQRLDRTQRAVVVDLNSPAQVGGQLASGDRVDVWVAVNAQATNGSTRPVVRELFQNVYVMNVGTNGTGNVTLRATPRQAGTLIYATENAKIWLVLRPTIGSTTTKPPVVTSNDLLGLPPVQIGGTR
jgi:Flp pilus assembly protein CpaB